MFLDPLYLLIMAPVIVLSLWASARTKSAFNRFAKVRNSRNISGALAAREMLDNAGLHNVRIERIGGFLSDHYDSRNRVLRLSPKVYDLPSVASVGVACHEAGHAIQHAKRYAPLTMRQTLVPVAQVSSYLAYIPILLSFVMGVLERTPVGMTFAWIGMILLGAGVLFAFVTLPVEFDASNRARKLIVQYGILSPSEERHVGTVLNAAAMTYVAAAASALVTLLYWAMRLGLLGGRRD